MAKQPQKIRKPTCKSCGRLHDQAQVCQMCGYCAMYCGCQCKVCRCDSLKHPPGHWCAVCGCKKRCVCRNKPKFLQNILWATPKDSALTQCPRPVGIELELANWGRPSLIEEHSNRTYRPASFRFNFTHDGSVTGGHELVLMPLAGDAVLKGLTELSADLNVRRASPDRTCGLHIHVGATDMSMWELRRLVRLYHRLEPEIYNALITTERKNNAVGREAYFAYCQRPIAKLWPRLATATTTSEIKHELIDMIYGVQFSEMPEEQIRKDGRCRCGRRCDILSDKLCVVCFNQIIADYQLFQGRRADKYALQAVHQVGSNRRIRNTRYWGMNLHSWFHRGTVEFRMKEATTDLQELLCWTVFCMHVVHAASGLSDKEVEEIEGLADFSHKRLPGWVQVWIEAKLRAMPTEGLLETVR